MAQTIVTIVLELLKAAGVIVAGVIAVHEIRQKGRITRARRWAIRAAVGAAVVSLATQVIQFFIDRHHDKNLEARAIAAEQQLKDLNRKQDRLNADQTAILQGQSPFDPVAIEASLTWPQDSPSWRRFTEAVKAGSVRTGAGDPATVPRGAERLAAFPPNMVTCQAVRAAGRETVGDLPFNLCSYALTVFVSSEPVEIAEYSNVSDRTPYARWDFASATPMSVRQYDAGSVTLGGEPPQVWLRLAPTASTSMRPWANISNAYDLVGKTLTLHLASGFRSFEAEEQTPPLPRGGIDLYYGPGFNKRIELPLDRFQHVENHPLTFTTTITDSDLSAEKSLRRP